MIGLIGRLYALLWLAAASVGSAEIPLMRKTPLPCPCADPALCKPLKPVPKPTDEVVAFPGDEIYGTRG